MQNRELVFDIFGIKVDFGWGSLDRLGAHAKRLNAKKAFIVTDEGIEKCGFVEKTVGLLKKSGIDYQVYKDISSNPTDNEVVSGAKIYRDAGCDLIFGIGGGSPMDAAKGICVMAVHDDPIDQYYGIGVEKIINKLPPLILIPTTSGTGSEVSRSGIITNTKKQRKEVLRSGMATLALVDPSLTVDLPNFLTAATGIDALSHNLEALETNIFNPIAEAIAFEGVQLVAQSLVRVVENGKSQKDRENMAMASLMGALAFQKGLCIAHSMAHQVSAVFGAHHGVSIGIMLPHSMEFNLDFAREKLQKIATAFGNKDNSPINAINEVRSLILKIGLPSRLSEIGVKEEGLKVMSKMAMDDWCVKFNPRPVNESDMLSLYQKAY